MVEPGREPVRLDRFEALSFDCYGTLIDWESGIAAALSPWARAAGLEPDDEALLAAYAGHEARAEREFPGEPYPQILGRSLTALGEQFGVPVSREDARAFGRSVPQWPAFPDSAGALALLARRYRLVILSNVDRESFAGSNRRLGVGFDRVITAEDVGAYKPSPRSFRALLAAMPQLGVREGGLLHVAQSLFHDHVPAKAAGLPTVWIDRRRGREGWGATPPPDGGVRPDLEFGSLAEFARACETAFGDG